MPYTVSQIANIVNGEVIGNPEVVLTGFSAANNAKEGDLTFAEKEQFFEQALQSGASAILIDKDFKSDKKTLIKVKNVRVAFAKVIELFYPESNPQPRIHPQLSLKLLLLIPLLISARFALWKITSFLNAA